MFMLYSKKISWIAAGILTAAVFSGCGNSAGCIFSTEKNDSIIYAGVMADRNNGFAVGELGNVRFTEDGGKTWQKGENHSMCLFSLSPINEKICYAAGNEKAFVKTVDGGKNWTLVKEHPAKKAKGLTFDNEDYGCLWTTSAAYEFQSASEKWTLINKPENCGLVESVFAVAPGEIYFCGSNGMIYFSSDYGTNWNECQKIFDAKNDEIKPVVGQWTKTSEFSWNGKELRFAYIGEKNYAYSLFIYKSLDNGKTFAKETELKLQGLAKAIAFNSRNEISVFNTDCTMDVYSLK